MSAPGRQMTAINGLIPPFADHPAILAWDIKNEPNRDYDLNTQVLVDAWLRHIAVVRCAAERPNHLLTIGWSQPEAATVPTDIVDFISFHYFEEVADYSPRLEQLWAVAQGKPVLLQEFVMSTWNSLATWSYGRGTGALLRRPFTTASVLSHGRLSRWTLQRF